MAKVLVVAPYAPSLIPFRGDLLRDLVRRGHEVHAAAPEPGYEKSLAALGVRYWRIPLARTGVSPLADLRALVALVRLIRRLRPQLVLSYAIKPVIYGSLAARAARVPAVYSMVTGLGSLFVEDVGKARVLKSAALRLYKAAFQGNRAIFFLNPDDRRFFEERGLLPNAAVSVVVPGSGVNLERFPFAPPPDGPPVFLLLARLIRHKGIAEYAEAASTLKRRHPEASFRLLGPTDTNPTAFREEDIRAWELGGAMEYLGSTEDVYPHIAASSVYVLPSYYREGVPRSILEAMAVGRAIVTTDVPGCRETVVHGVNGFLVPPKDVATLANAMEKFILEPRLIPEMGRESRRLAEEKFDVRGVNARILETMGLS
ncbi:MAG: glycosyltransferase family 4 protein [Planctomycetota bacterium]